MAAPACTFDGLNINDGATYTVMPGVIIGAKKKTWDEYRGLAGTPTAVNVSEAYYVEMTVPLRIQGSSTSDLRTKIAAVNTKVDGCTPTATKTLAYDGTNYTIALGKHIEWTCGQREQNAFYTICDLKLWRTP